ncbi:MAG: nucleotidyl transferase AbiEii/AbiGii toxin family protein [Patescibacteria group bacterium]
MLNREKHQLLMGRILRDLYADTSIAPLLGFKGGTCAYFFYDLPRFSVDLDFDLLKTDEETQKFVFDRVGTILQQYGEIKDKQIKRFTVFFLLSYGDTDHNIKIEINVRQLMPDMNVHYEIKEYLGIAMLVGKRDYLFASKLAALTLRTQTAMRDIYDVWYFAKSNWEIDPAVIKARTGKMTKDYLADCIATIEQVKDNQILQGLGELLNEKDKSWVKNHLRTETVFLLKNYKSVLK